MKKTPIGERIRRIRASKGYSQANVAEDLGITSGAYAKIERGETDPSAGRLIQIADILQVRITDFFEEQVAAAERINSYGFASREEVESLTKVVQTLVKEVEKLRQDILPQRTSKKNKKKKL